MVHVATQQSQGWRQLGVKLCWGCISAAELVMRTNVWLGALLRRGFKMGPILNLRRCKVLSLFLMWLYASSTHKVTVWMHPAIPVHGRACQSSANELHHCDSLSNFET